MLSARVGAIAALVLMALSVAPASAEAAPPPAEPSGNGVICIDTRCIQSANHPGAGSSGGGGATNEGSGAGASSGNGPADVGEELASDTGNVQESACSEVPMTPQPEDGS